MLTMRRLIGVCFATGFGACLVSPPGLAAGISKVNPAAAMAKLDTDHDGTLDLNEAKAAAEAKFDALDADHDGTLDRHELAGLLTRPAFAKADPDHDGTIDKNEYMALATGDFEQADPDHDGTISLKELSSPAGRRLLSLLAY